ncbi:hypothetical protein TEA_021584 [Camellia sinensis var. sinensis]|uniref:AMP-dependent synthetase/ligase domain-containing protein n=1 Tax=Camellia sinensis var. sinensis TaxID=542762 RepID=A0A4S4D160_CAMSN|nr:hypothetical protein TEA_021584 [Camellia sinensis var. sinensis]
MVRSDLYLYFGALNLGVVFIPDFICLPKIGLCLILPVFQFQLWIYGNSFESFLVAVVNPNKQALERWAEANGVPGDFDSLCEIPKAKEYILGELTRVAKEKQLKGFEFIRAVHLDPVPFDMDRDLITPTFKKKRPQLLKYYQVALLLILPRNLIACLCTMFID